MVTGRGGVLRVKLGGHWGSVGSPWAGGLPGVLAVSVASGGAEGFCREVVILLLLLIVMIMMMHVHAYVYVCVHPGLCVTSEGHLQVLLLSLYCMASDRTQVSRLDSTDALTHSIIYPAHLQFCQILLHILYANTFWGSSVIEYLNNIHLVSTNNHDNVMMFNACAYCFTTFLLKTYQFFFLSQLWTLRWNCSLLQYILGSWF